jgi:hypothetical protein
MQSHHAFSFDITLRHPSEAPEVITRTLSLKPNFAWASGSEVGTRSKKATAWNGTIASFTEVASADDVLRSVTEFFNCNREYCRSFIDTGGEIDLILKGKMDQTVAALNGDQDEFKSKVFDLTLYPEFLKSLSISRVAFVIQMWAN